MRATVNENCIACGMCIGICGEIFSMGGDGFAHGSDFDAAHLEAAQTARDNCPVDAISIEE